MKKTSLFFLLAGGLFFASCKEQAKVDDNALNAQVETAAAEQLKTINDEAIANCEMRMTTEVAGKRDSIINARQMAAAAQ